MLYRKIPDMFGNKNCQICKTIRCAGCFLFFVCKEHR